MGCGGIMGRRLGNDRETASPAGPTPAEPHSALARCLAGEASQLSASPAFLVERKIGPPGQRLADHPRGERRCGQGLVRWTEEPRTARLLQGASDVKRAVQTRPAREIVDPESYRYTCERIR